MKRSDGDSSRERTRIGFHSWDNSDDEPSTERIHRCDLWVSKRTKRRKIPKRLTDLPHKDTQNHTYLRDSNYPLAPVEAQWLDQFRNVDHLYDFGQLQLAEHDECPGDDVGRVDPQMRLSQAAALNNSNDTPAAEQESGTSTARERASSSGRESRRVKLSGVEKNIILVLHEWNKIPRQRIGKLNHGGDRAVLIPKRYAGRSSKYNRGQQFRRIRGRYYSHDYPGSIWFRAAEIAYVPPDNYGARSSLKAPPKRINGVSALPSPIRVRNCDWLEDSGTVSYADEEVGLVKRRNSSPPDPEERVLFRRRPALTGYGHAIIDSDTEASDDDTEYASMLTAGTYKKMRVPKAFLLPARLRHTVTAGSQWLGECSATKDEMTKASRLLTIPAEVRALVYKWLFIDAEIVNPHSDFGQREGYEGWVILKKGKVENLVSILDTCNTFYNEGFPLFWKYASVKILDPCRAMFTMLLPPPGWYTFVQRWTGWPLYMLSDIRYDFLPSLKYLELTASRTYTLADAVSAIPSAYDLVKMEHAPGLDVLNAVPSPERPFNLTSWEYLQLHLIQMPKVEYVLKWLLHEPYHGPLQEGKAWESTYITVSWFEPYDPTSRY